MAGTALIMCFAEEDEQPSAYYRIDDATMQQHHSRIAYDPTQATAYNASQAVRDALLLYDAEGSAELPSTVRRVSAELGRSLACEIDRILRLKLYQGVITGITIVPCGHLTATIPIGIAQWKYGLGDRCLLDLCPIRYAPSGFIAGHCARVAADIDRQIAQGARPLRLLTMSDPEGWYDDRRETGPRGLSTAKYELDTIEKLFPSDSTEYHSGSRATLKALKAGLQNAKGPPTHLLISAHGEGSISTRGSTGIILAKEADPEDGRNESSNESGDVLAASQIPLAIDCDLRCVFLSACSTAAFHFPAPDEILTVPSALIVSGAAAVVGSIWPVDDFVSSMFSTKFFEFSVRGDHNPAVALRNTQNWMRTLRKPNLSDMNPLLATHWTTWGKKRDQSWASRYPLQDPIYWAGWILLGA